MAKLLLVRHGITEFNSTRRFAGHSDVEISGTGHEQAEKLRDRLADEKIDAVYCSDLRRALVTAEIVSSGHQVDIVTCPELREINYGEAEGLTFDEISRSHPEVSEMIANFSLELSFPGGETFAGFMERTNTFLRRLEKHPLTDTILVVAHGGPLRVLVCSLLGLNPLRWRQLRCDNASLSIVETNRRQPILSLLNDTSHLKNGI